MAVERAVETFVGIAHGVFDKFGAGEGVMRVFHEGLEQGKLGGRELDGVAVARQAVLVKVETQVACGENARGRGGAVGCGGEWRGRGRQLRAG